MTPDARSDDRTIAIEATLAAIDTWGADHASAAVVSPGWTATRGDPTHVYRWASVTKLLTAYTVLIARERGVLDLDEPVGPPGATVRHLLAHASGLPFEGASVLAQPGTRRIYSNPGFDALGELVADRSGDPFEAALDAWVLRPLGMTGATLVDRPSQGLHGPLVDLVAFARELLQPRLLSAAVVHAEATSVAFPGLVGVVPGVGRFDPCDWGLGFELRDAKAPHWMGTRNSPATYGHFGGAGTFVWVDPAVDVALVVLTDREFDRWALDAWPRLSDEILAAVSSGRRSQQA
jgi:CubicO group peptidase (beta-lactamase class C family)